MQTDIADRPLYPPRLGLVAGFVAGFLALYAAAAWVAEVTVGRAGSETAFQHLLALRGTDVDWAVLGASHALPLAYGDVPAHLHKDTGQSMAVLAEVGAGPLYNLLVFRQALRDIRPRRLLYVVDSFAFAAPLWNEDRLSDRKLLRRTPLRPSTAATMAAITLRHRGNLAGLADYLTGFSKLNPSDRFPQAGWRGGADFDRKVRLSRHAVQSRIGYLYPAPPNAADQDRYLDILAALFDEARAAGIDIVVIKLPLPDAFRAALPDETGFDAALGRRLAPRDIAFHDLSVEMSDAAHFFDTDHLNRSGVDALYTRFLKDMLAP